MSYNSSRFSQSVLRTLHAPFAAAACVVLLAALTGSSKLIQPGVAAEYILPAASTPASHLRLAQVESDDSGPVAESQVKKYIAVYSAMQRNHSLTIKQAAAAQGFSVPQFRALEAKIERNGPVRERVRRALRKNAESAHSKKSAANSKSDN